MALMDDLRTKLTAIGNAIRSKTGGGDPLTLDGMVDAINSISTGGGGGGGGGTSGPVLDNGFTINFYNHDKELIEVHSAKCGMYIDKPLSYEAESWQNDNGYINSFPLTVNSAGAVVDLYAGGSATCAQMLYSYYGVDAGEYPLVYMHSTTDSNVCTLYFAKTASWRYSGYSIVDMTHVIRSTKSVSFQRVTYGSQDKVQEWVDIMIGQISKDDLETLDSLSIGPVGSGMTAHPGAYFWYNTLPTSWNTEPKVTILNLNVEYEA